MEKQIKIILLLSLGFLFAGCGPGAAVGLLSQFQQHPDEAQQPDGSNDSQEDPDVGRGLPIDEYSKVILSAEMNIRVLRNQVLETIVMAPAGTEIEVPSNSSPVNYNYRKDNGQVAFSSTGFFGNVVIIKSGDPAKLSAGKIAEIQQTPGGLFITATIASELLGPGSFFTPLSAAQPGEGFLQYYQITGKPKFSYSSSIRKRFPGLVNKAIPMSQLPTQQQSKWNKIMKELVAVSNRTQASMKKYLAIDKKEAQKLSLQFEQKGTVPLWGAWSVAVLGTATRHGFANVPCAEFMSELLRQAYKRAGFKHTDDFNSAKNNKLTYSNGAAAVVNFSMYLSRAGFIPWDSTQYRPPIGAFLMNGTGNSPGHTYIAAGDSGRFIVDNGSPKGRDLRSTTGRTINIMYQTGVFFLPPGFIPTTW
jgi:hypothetical protein